jgi:hypothetical protein
MISPGSVICAVAVSSFLDQSGILDPIQRPLDL